MGKTKELLRSELVKAHEVGDSGRVSYIQSCFRELSPIETPNTNWISVDGALPDGSLEGYSVICGTTSGTCIACVGKNGVFLDEFRGMLLSFKVTHWMELPESPTVRD